MIPVHTNPARTTRRSLLHAAALCLGLLAAAAPLRAEDDLPGKGIQAIPLKSSIAEETFQTLLVMRALQRLGYAVQPIQEIEYATAHVAIANGDATFMADHWNPQHADFYKNAGGDTRLYRQGIYIANNAQGYLIDKKTAEAHKITRIDQLKDPQIARLFDTDGDGKADLAGCNPGWGCEGIIEHHLGAYGLRETVKHNQGSYSALLADTIARYRAGKPVLYYAWTPHWVSNELQPGKDVVWLEVPFSSLPSEQKGLETKLPNGKNYGFVVNQQQIVANKAWAEKNPAAAKLFSIMQLPVGDVSAQNHLMSQGQNQAADVARHTDAWIAAHQKTFDGWIAQALAAVKK